MTKHFFYLISLLMISISCNNQNQQNASKKSETTVDNVSTPIQKVKRDTLKSTLPSQHSTTYYSSQDSLAGIEVKKDSLIMFYTGNTTKASDHYQMNFSDTLYKDGTLLKKGPFLTLKNDSSALQYIVNEWNDTIISLIYLERGNTLTYIKN